MHEGQQLNQEILLEQIGFPEFLPTQRMAGPIQTTLFQNSELTCNVILGMDVMQALGINIICLTKTITWNGMKIPF